MLVQNEFSGTETEPKKPGVVCVFRRDIATGRLTPTEHSIEIEKPMYVGVLPKAE
jgi:6-phosphogluconolactonase (cycloisomerase 2 family)|eukprot:COSAG06_NODE_1147_length_10512_cov_5.815615_6_plen_55_part_00